MPFLVAGIAIQFLAIVVLAFFRDTRRALAVMHVLLVAGLGVGLAASLSALVNSHGTHAGFIIAGLPANVFRLDPLALFFLCVIQLVSIPTALYSYSYFREAARSGRSVHSMLVIFGVLLISTQLLVIVDHAILFLVFWEIMSIAAYFGIVFEQEKKETRTGGMYYFAVSHLIVFLLYAFFFLMHASTGSWLMSDCLLSADAGSVFYAMYALALIGFGMKAGFMPFHFWLPRAHPVAPAVISAFMSGIIIKTGIYGLLRTYQMLNPVPEFLGWIVLVAGMISAIFGVWYALAQHDIKRLLAYHSVENIGIIGIGIGIGFIGSAYHSLPIQLLGFGGALLHTLNHAIFKSLLFIGSGVIVGNTGTHIIEQMGGIIHRARYFAVLFLIGSVAISGLPPLNGFISEFILYNAFFSAAKDLQHYYPLAMLIVTVGLAFVGGLAVACFTKLNAIVFLGRERLPQRAFIVTPYEYAALGILASLCVIIGVYPSTIVGIVNGVVSSGMLAGERSPALMDIDWLFLSGVTGISALLVLLLLLAKSAVQKKFGSRISDTWACGYAAVTPRMQYTASSFSDALNTIAHVVLRYEKTMHTLTPTQQEATAVSTHSSDLVDTRVLLPGVAFIRATVLRIRLFRTSDVRAYIASVLITIVVYSIVAFLWK
ncbi:MAG: proton-conducting transporter membrane subunit [Bacteroidota bacterium]